VFGGKYYICGVAGTEKAVIWKNSTTPTEFEYDPGQGEQVDGTVLNSIFAYGDNQYNLGGYAVVQGARWAFMNGRSMGGNEAEVTAVYVYNNIMYGVGHYRPSGSTSYTAFMWELPGTNLTLSTNNADANCVFVNETGKYVGGNENGVAVYWKDGVKQSLAGAGNGSDVFAICVAERP
jgi:hypothetical protein